MQGRGDWKEKRTKGTGISRKMDLYEYDEEERSRLEQALIDKLFSRRERDTRLRERCSRTRGSSSAIVQFELGFDLCYVVIYFGHIAP